MTERGGPRIGVWGTFDLDNFGDVLYPRIVDRALRERLPEADVRFMSPLGPGNTRFFDPVHPVEALGPWSEERLDELARELDCVAIGGGDIAHLEDAAYAPHYHRDPEEMAVLAPGRYFLEGLGPERERECPVVWNAVGVPHDFSPGEAAVIRAALEGRPYLAVRDELSRRRLEEAGVERDIEVVPDQAVLAPRLLPPEDLHRRLKHLRLMGWYPASGMALVVQANGTLLPFAADVAAAVRAIVEERPELRVVFVEPGGVHGDVDFAKAVAEALPFRTHHLPAASGIEDLAAAVAFSAAFIGSSLHGFILATGYGRPGVALHLNDFSKIPGFADLAGRSHCIAGSAAEIRPALERAEREPPDRAVLAALHSRVERHFDRVAEVAEKSAADRGPQDDSTRIRNLERRVARLERAAEESRARAIEERAAVDAAVWKMVEERSELTAQARSPLAVVAGRIQRLLGRVAPLGTRRRSFLATPVRAFVMIVQEGWGAFFRHLPKVHRWGPKMWRREREPEVREGETEYEVWHRIHRIEERDIREMRRRERRLAYRPLVSVITPTYESDPAFLRAALDSVRAQAYPNWEHCIADDASRSPGTRETLREYEARDPRIRVAYRETNGGIVEASNTALDMARGEFVAFLDHDDELRADALFEVVRLLNEQPDLDYVYSDQDLMQADGRRIEVFPKPDWSPDLLMSMNYLTHLSVYRRELVERLGHLRPGYEGSQDYDLALRVTESTDRIGHVPKPLYSWRMAHGSVADSKRAKPYAYEAAKRALRDALRRRGERGEVLDGVSRGCYRVRYEVQGEPRVGVVIADQDGRWAVPTAHAVQALSTYGNVDLAVAGPVPRGSGDGVRRLDRSDGGRGVLLNAGAAATSGEYLLFLEPGLEAMTPDWIQALLEHAQRAAIGVVGARLFSLAFEPVHEGMVVGLAGRPGTPVTFDGHLLLQGASVRNCSAVQLGALMIRRELFDEVGGFDEATSDAWVDVDLCLRVGECGYRVLYTPHAALRYVRGPKQTGELADAVGGDMPRPVAPDPFYNPTFDPDRPLRLRF